MTALDNPQAFRLEGRPGDFKFYTVADYAEETKRAGARVCGLFLEPQPGCHREPVTYTNGNALVDIDRAKPTFPASFGGVVPLYLGPVFRKPAIGGQS